MQSFALATLVTAAAAISADERNFMNYAAKFNKVYEDVEEFVARLERFVHWHRIITEHNGSNGANYTLGHNQFSDWTDSEYESILNFKFS